MQIWYAGIRKTAAIVCGFALLIGAAPPIQATAAAQQSGRRAQLQQAIAGRYRLTEIGPGVLGLRGTRASIRKVGGVVTLRRAGLSASLERDDPASYLVAADRLDLYRGVKAVAVQPGEKFYVHSVGVGSDVVTLGMVSVRDLTAGNESAPVWLGLSFTFSGGQVEKGDIEAIYAVLDQWVLPEGQFAAPVESRVAAAPAPPAAPAAPAAANVELKVGMPAAEVTRALGEPVREVTFEGQSWLSYPGMVVLIREAKLVSALAAERLPATVHIESQPEHAELFVDGNLVGGTPAQMQLPPGSHKIVIRAAGYRDWVREVNLLEGSRVTLNAALER